MGEGESGGEGEVGTPNVGMGEGESGGEGEVGTLNVGMGEEEGEVEEGGNSSKIRGSGRRC
jgi:hypothetical protein